MSKEIKQWGVVGGLESRTKTWTVPSGMIFDMTYRKEESYTQENFTDFGSVIEEIAESYEPDWGTDYVIYHELTYTFGRPFDSLTVRTGRANKIHYDCRMKPLN